MLFRKSDTCSRRRCYPACCRVHVLARGFPVRQFRPTPEVSGDPPTWRQNACTGGIYPNSLSTVFDSTGIFGCFLMPLAAHPSGCMADRFPSSSPRRAYRTENILSCTYDIRPVSSLSSCGRGCRRRDTSHGECENHITHGRRCSPCREAPRSGLTFCSDQSIGPASGPILCIHATCNTREIKIEWA